MSKELKIIFIGTPDFAVESLKAIVAAGKNVVAVITAPDRKAGRGLKINESAVKKFAVENDLPVLQPTNLKNENFINRLKSFQANLQVVVAFRMLPEVVWNMPEFGTFNLHASLLPQYRGAAPINWAIINGEKKTGVSTFFLKHKIDTGDLIDQISVEIKNRETFSSLHDTLMKLGGKLVLNTVNAIEKGKCNAVPQNPSLLRKEAPKLNKENTKVDWNKSILQNDRLIRGLSPYPAAWCKIIHKESKKSLKVKLFNCNLPLENQKLKVGEVVNLNGNLYIGCSDGALEIKELQLEGKKRMDSKALMNGFKIDDYSAI